MKVLFVITALGPGGAERMLVKLVEASRLGIEPIVVSLGTVDLLSERLRAAGARVHVLGMGGLRSLPVAVRDLARLYRYYQPAVVNTWMYHADLVGALASTLVRAPALAWNIRNGDLSPEQSKRSTRVVARVNAMLSSRLPDAILCCSEQARQIHVGLGYDAERFVVIPNGFDLGSYRPDPGAASSVRAELGIPVDAPIIGLIARYDPQKNHLGFIEAAARLHRIRPDVRFVLAGHDIDGSNPALTGPIRAHGLEGAMHLLGHRKDVSRITASLDVATSASTYGEAFPNVLGEAMACGVPCVATTVGDSAYIVGDTGIAVPPADTGALVAAWERLLAMPADARRALGARARERVAGHFEIGMVAARYEQVFRELAERRVGTFKPLSDKPRAG